ncbi:MAG: cyanophycinase, partial [Pyrinomonadaceae bacterium]
MTESHDREIIGGHLLVIGGAEDKYNERRILKKFLSLAGDEKAEVLIVPAASDFPEFAADVYTQAFRNLGVANPRVLRATSRQDVFDADPEELLGGVTGVFITGGDQMRLVSLLGGTKFAAKLRQMVRDTNLVLAGTSAGAAGMSTSMIVRGDSTSHPHKGSVRLSPGLGFLKNIIIDQHFTERGRISRLITAVSY